MGGSSFVSNPIFFFLFFLFSIDKSICVVFVNKSINKSKFENIDYIFHIDSDELIYIKPFDNIPKYQLLRNYLNNINPIYDSIHLNNYEAVFSNINTKCFDTNRFINCNLGSCLSYGNGKSVGRVKNNIKFNGPHNFTGHMFNMNNDIIILHFDSCNFLKWKEKFNNLKNISEEKYNKIPFDFYKNSIRKLQKVNNNKDLENFYYQNKIKPYYENNLITIDLFN